MATLGSSLENTPAGVPPPGLESNLINPPNYNNAAIATAAICVATTTIAVAARLVTRALIIHRTAIEDCKLIVSQGVTDRKVTLCRYGTNCLGMSYSMNQYVGGTSLCLHCIKQDGFDSLISN